MYGARTWEMKGEDILSTWVRTDGRRRWVIEWGIAVMGKLRKQRAREARRSGFPCPPDYSYSITHMIMYCVNPSEYGVRDQISPDLFLLYFPYRVHDYTLALFPI